MKIMQIEQEMSIRMVSKRSPPSNLVAKLMGLDSIPIEEPDSIIGSGHSRSHSDIPLSYWEVPDDRFFHHVELDRYGDVYEVSKQPFKFRHKEGSIIERETIHDKMMVLVRQKFLEVKSRGEKNRHSKQFKEESTSIVHPPPPPRKTERITVLNTSEMSNNVSFVEVNLDHASSTQPTRIVVLEPKRHKAGSLYSSQLDSPKMLGEEFICDVEDDDGSYELRDSVKAITIQMRRKLSRHYIDETLNSEADMSPSSRHSWDYLSRSGIPYSPSGFSRASYSGESSVSREAKKRLSERWALMASSANSCRSSSTLGEMLSLSEVKKKVTKAKGKCEEHKNSNPKLCNERRADRGGNGSPRNHKRSKSLPTSSALSGTKLNVDSLVLESKHGSLRETTSFRSSLKEKVTSLFFSKKKKTSKDKALRSDKKNELRRVSGEFDRGRNGALYNEVLRHSSSDLQEPSCIGSLATVIGKHDMGFLEVGSTPRKSSTSQNPGENQDHPSPISVLDTQFEEDELLTAKVFPQCEQLDRHGFQFHLDPISSRLLAKSPLIGSVHRTLSWYPAKESLNIQESGDKQEWILFVKTLLSTVLHGDMLWSTFFSRWHSPESPLNPSLREIDFIFKDNETPNVAKRRRQRSIQKLVFDLVNALLLDTGHEASLNQFISPLIEAKKGNLFKNISSSTVLDEATSQVTAWFCGETRCFSDNFTDENTLVVEQVVTKEVSGKGWRDKLSLEMDKLGKEMGQKLLDELVLETLFEIGR